MFVARLPNLSDLGQILNYNKTSRSFCCVMQLIVQFPQLFLVLFEIITVISVR